jgi:hypothetical protein
MALKGGERHTKIYAVDDNVTKSAYMLIMKMKKCVKVGGYSISCV